MSESREMENMEVNVNAGSWTLGRFLGRHGNVIDTAEVQEDIPSPALLAWVEHHVADGESENRSLPGRGSEAVQRLTDAAIEAYASGTSWAAFWRAQGSAVVNCEPINRRRFADLRQRLLSLVVSGDTGPKVTEDDPPEWELDYAWAAGTTPASHLG